MWRSVVAAVFLLSPTTAQAQASSGELGAAQALFDRAVELMGDGRFDEACPKLEEVVRLVPEGLGAKLRLADCYEQAGKLASAWTTYVLAEEGARREGQAARAAHAHERAEALAPRLRRLRIDVAAASRALPELVIRRDGRVVRAPEWGVDVIVDPGRHLVEAEAPGHRRWSTAFDIQTEDIGVEVPMLERVAAPAPIVQPASPVLVPTVPVRPPSPLQPTPPPVDEESSVPAWAWVCGGAGLAFSGVAIGFLVDQARTQSRIDDSCGFVECEPGFDRQAANDRLYRDYGLGVGFGVAGLVGIGAALVGIVTAPSTRRSSGAAVASSSFGGAF